MINIDTRLLEDLNEDEFWLLCHIAKRFGRELSCFPSNTLLCTDTGWNLKKLQQVKGSLIDRGFLMATTRVRKGHQTSNEYKCTTDLLGVYVPAKSYKITLENDEVEGGGMSQKGIDRSGSNGLRGSGSKTDNEVLTSEVLLFPEASSGVSKKPIPSKGKVRKEKKPEERVYMRVVDFWLKIFRPAYQFGAVDGAKLKSILRKISGTWVETWKVRHPEEVVPEPTEEDIFHSFEHFCRALPDFYKKADLAMLDSKYNTIVYEQQTGRQNDNFTSKNSTDRFSDLAGSFAD